MKAARYLKPFVRSFAIQVLSQLRGAKPPNCKPQAGCRHFRWARRGLPWEPTGDVKALSTGLSIGAERQDLRDGIGRPHRYVRPPPRIQGDLVQISGVPALNGSTGDKSVEPVAVARVVSTIRSINVRLPLTGPASA